MSKKRKKPRKKRKLGTAYEELVSEILHAFDPEARVRRGHWVQGPDGPRELDVEFYGTIEDAPKTIIVECKDFDPASTGKVGIGFVDALESKRNDLSCDLAILCSNAGFTDGAVRKAARVGIGLVAVAKRGDKRARFVIRTTLYSRDIRVTDIRLSLHSEGSNELPPARELVAFGKSVDAWVGQKITALIGANPIVNGAFAWSCKFTSPIVFQADGADVIATSVTTQAKLEGSWYVHDVAIEATSGLYDWL